jgi:carotenoid cleavage dioxygenase
MPDGSQFHLEGNFAPISIEHDEHDLPVSGELPRGLNGTLYRNGPNPQFPEAARRHWFLGDGMVHAFALSDGRAAWRNRWVRTHKWQAERAAGRPLVSGLPRPTLPGFGIRDSGVANTNIVFHAGRLLALEEAHPPFELDPATLETRGVQDFGTLRGPFTAHPKTDPRSGELLFFGYAVGSALSPMMAHGSIDASGRVTRIERFAAPYCAMVHDFAVTENHVLFPVMPLTGSLWRAMTRGMPFAWEPGLGGYIGLLRRDAGVDSLRWLHAESCFVFHLMNAWETPDGRIQADVMRYGEPPLFPRADGSMPELAGIPARLVRWTLDPAAPTDRVVTTPLDDLPGEFPRIDERRTGLPNRHGAFVAMRPGALFDTLAWKDVVTGTRAEFTLPPGDSLSEAVFVPRAPDAPEGDGWLLAIAWRAAIGRSDLLVFDTAAVADGPVAAIHLPGRVPVGFHGNWVPA